ncbi:MAG: hypothetical protein AB2L20_01610 [Mangrovibacterium sp.]
MCKKYITPVCLMIALSGCNYLDFDEATGQSKDFAYGYFDELGKNVTNLYGQLQNEYGTLDGALREAATDNAVYTWQNNQVYDIYNNVWSPINTIDSNWDFYYRAIRSANNFSGELFFGKSLNVFSITKNYEDDLAKVQKFIHMK